MGKREETKRANRAAIVGAGQRVFATIGHDAATVRDIVRESGLAIGSFYNYFPDKTAIFEVIVDQLFTQLGDSLPPARRDAEDVRGFLLGPYELVAAAAVGDPQTAALIARNQTALRDRFYLAGAQSSIQQTLQDDLEAWVADGRMVPHDTARMAEAMISLGMDLLIQTSLDPPTASERVAFVVALFERALVPARPPETEDRRRERS